MIDCHLHLAHEGRTPEQTLAHITGLGCCCACLLPLESWDRPDDYNIPTEDVLEVYQQAPDLVLPFCCVDPRAEDGLQRIEKYAAAGCKGFGELKVRLPVDHPGSKAIYRLCGELGLPVTVHLEEHNYNTSVLNFEKVLEEFPDTIFIGHAQSFWAYLEPSPEPVNGYPMGPIPEPGPTVRWLRDYPNLYADLSAGSGLNALTRDEDFTREVLLGELWPKLLFATDCPCLDGNGANWPEGCFGRRSVPVIERLSPSDEAVAAVLHNNAARLFDRPLM
ncbi:MAG: amidohydrolase family protein [Armatimonadetes bacterium]|nr:amidohydrolase family protein [Armatimonadota bacterium]